jgi:hypothetical protein
VVQRIPSPININGPKAAVLVHDHEGFVALSRH